MIKNIQALFILILISLNLKAQLPSIISSDMLEGTFIDFTTDGDGNYYALNDQNKVFQFNLEGEVLGVTEWDCGFICDLSDMEFGPEGKMYFTSTRDGLFVVENGELTNIIDQRFGAFAIDQNGVIAVLGQAPIAPFVLQVFENESWTNFSISNSPFINTEMFDIVVDKDNTFWIACLDGVFSYKDGQFKKYSDMNAYHIHASSNGTISVVFSSKSIGYINADENEVTIIPWQDAEGRFACINSEGTIYAADGTDIFIRKAGSWAEYDLDDLDVNGFIEREMFMDDQGNVFYSILSNNDIFFWESTVVGIKEIPQNINLSVYPNPTSGTVIIDSEIAITKIVILNQLGMKVKEINGKDSLNQLNIGNLTNGIYHLKFITSEGERTQKIIITK